MKFTMKNHVSIRVCLINFIFIVVGSNCLDYFVDNSDFFRNKTILAPMLQVNTLSFRLLALEQGADIVYSEEIPDHKLVKCVRRTHDYVADVVEYINQEDGAVVFQTCRHERGKVILQIGVTDPNTALEAAFLIQRDVAGIDINLEYADFDLMKNITFLKATLKKIRKAVCIPVTCKIRILPTIEETKSLCKHLEMTGISAIAIHGRTVHEKPWKPNRNHFIVDITREISIPIIACGGSNNMETYDDIFKFKNGTNCSSVMIGRAAQYNCSIFSKTNSSSIDALAERYVKLAITFKDPFSKVQYCLSKMLKRSVNNSLIEQFSQAESMEKISKIFNLGNYYREIFKLNLYYYKQRVKARKSLSERWFRGKELMSKVLSGAVPVIVQIFMKKIL